MSDNRLHASPEFHERMYALRGEKPSDLGDTSTAAEASALRKALEGLPKRSYETELEQLRQRAAEKTAAAQP